MYDYNVVSVHATSKGTAYVLSAANLFFIIVYKEQKIIFSIFVLWTWFWNLSCLSVGANILFPASVGLLFYLLSMTFFSIHILIFYLLPSHSSSFIVNHFSYAFSYSSSSCISVFFFLLTLRCSISPTYTHRQSFLLFTSSSLSLVHI